MKKKDRQPWKSSKSLSIRNGLKYLAYWSLEIKMGRWTTLLLQTDSLTLISECELQKLTNWIAFSISTLVKSESLEAAEWPIINNLIA